MKFELFKQSLSPSCFLLLIVLAAVPGKSYSQAVKQPSAKSIKPARKNNVNLIRLIPFTGKIGSYTVAGELEIINSKGVSCRYRDVKSTSQDYSSLDGKIKGDSLIFWKKHWNTDVITETFYGVLKGKAIVGRWVGEKNTFAFQLDINCKDWLRELSFDILTKPFKTKHCYKNEWVLTNQIDIVRVYKNNLLHQTISNVYQIPAYGGKVKHLIELEDINQDGYFDLKVMISAPCQYLRKFDYDFARYLYNPKTGMFDEMTKTYWRIEEKP